jgi:hypothetical protein
MARNEERRIKKTVFDIVQDNEDYTERERIKCRRRLEEEGVDINWDAAPGPGNQRTKWKPEGSRWTVVDKSQVGGITSSREGTPRLLQQQIATAGREDKAKYTNMEDVRRPFSPESARIKAKLSRSFTQQSSDQGSARPKAKNEQKPYFVYAKDR